MASGSSYMDYRNNVIYNWGYNSCYGGENQQVGTSKFNFSRFNIVTKYFKPGPATQLRNVSYRICNPSTRNNETSDLDKWYVSGNVVVGNEKVKKDNWNGGVHPFGGDENNINGRIDKPWDTMLINQQTAEYAYELVLDNAGATLSKRDLVDIRIVNDARNGVATYEGVLYKKMKRVADSSKKTEIIDSLDDVGGWPLLKSITAPVDTDHDGMPYEWEKANNLNQNNPEDRNLIGKDVYTMLERYLNSIN